MIENKNVLWITTRNPNSYILRKIADRGVRVLNPIKKKSFFQKIIRKFSYSVSLLSKFWYLDEICDQKSFDLIFVEYSLVLFGCVPLLRMQNPQAKIVIWNENPIKGKFFGSRLRSYQVLFSSFDKRDCLKYQMFYNNDFLFSDMKLSASKEKTIDFLFVGQDKGRKKEINKLTHDLQNWGFSVYLKIPRKKKDYIKYEDYLELITKSRVLIDITQKGQYGLSLRPLEALYAQTKLLTNNCAIQQMDYYNDANVFVLHKCSLKKDEITAFVKSPYQKQSESVMLLHDFSSWIKKYL